MGLRVRGIGLGVLSSGFGAWDIGLRCLPWFSVFVVYCLMFVVCFFSLLVVVWGELFVVCCLLFGVWGWTVPRRVPCPPARSRNAT